MTLMCLAVSGDHVLILRGVTSAIVGLFRDFGGFVSVTIYCCFLGASDASTVFDVGLRGHGGSSSHATAHAATHTHLLEHAAPAEATTESTAEASTEPSTSKEVIIVIHHAEATKAAKWISLLALVTAATSSTASHHRWEVVIEEICEGVTPAEEATEDVVGFGEAESAATTSTAVEEG